MTKDIIFISDTHSKHWEVDEIFELSKMSADIIVHSGDMSSRGTRREIKDFLDWFNELPFKHKICIPGNHDLFFDYERAPKTHRGLTRFGLSKSTKSDVDELISEYPEIHILNDSGIELYGIKFWGSPITPWFHDWAFNRVETEINEHWNLILKDTDILITHGPPFLINDFTVWDKKNVGCPHLLNRVKEINPKIHAFGHIHEGYGKFQDEKTLYINASNLNVRYEVVNKPIKVKYAI